MYNVNSNWVLSATDSRRVTQDKSYSIANQEWTFESIGNNIWAIYSRSNHLALEIGGDDPTTYKAGTPANVWEYTGKTNQQWRIIDDYGNNLTLTDGSPTPVPIPRAIPFYHIINVRTGYALEIGGSTTERLQTNRPANQWPYSGGNHQKWRFGSGDLNRNAPTNPDITPTITFTPAIATITTATDNYDENTNFSVYPNPVQNYLFISSTGMKKVATAQLIDSQGKTFDPTHIYKIVNKSTGKALEVTGDHKFEPNSLIGQGDYSGGAHQQWIIKSVTRTRFYIINRNSRKVMATRDHDKYSGAPYVLREPNMEHRI